MRKKNIMSMDFHAKLKALGKEAKKNTQMKEQARIDSFNQEEEKVDFAKIIGKVKPLKNTKRYEQPRDKSPIKPRPKETVQLEDNDYFYVGHGHNDWDEPPATFSKNGQGKNDIQRLRNGHWPVVADVDLHGYSQEEAQKILNEFIEFTKKRGVCAEIVHGSGLGSAGYKSVLKDMTRRWLMQHPDVLAYVEPRVNNDGAVRILLKRNRTTHNEME